MRPIFYLTLPALIWGVATVSVAAAPAPAPHNAKTPHYYITGQIKGPDGLWDYAAIDAKARQLYIGKKGGLMVLDLAAGSDARMPPNARMLFNYPVIHQGLPLGNDRLVATTGPSNQALIVDRKSGRILAKIPTDKDPDAAAYDKKTGRAITFNRGDLTATIFDVESARVTGSVKLPEKAEFPVSDDNGTIYVNLSQTGRVGVIDIKTAKLTGSFALENCQEPTGLAYDRKSGYLISACSNGIADVVTPAGRPVASLKIGPEPDAVFIDAKRRLAFIPSGGDGTLSVISLATPENISVVQVVKTEIGVRTGAVDPESGKVYLPAGQLLPPKTSEKWPSVVPGSFKIIVIAP